MNINWRDAENEMPKIPKIPEGKSSIRVVALVKSGESPGNETWLTMATLYSDGRVLGPYGRLKLVKWTYPEELGLNEDET